MQITINKCITPKPEINKINLGAPILPKSFLVGTSQVLVWHSDRGMLRIKESCLFVDPELPLVLEDSKGMLYHSEILPGKKNLMLLAADSFQRLAEDLETFHCLTPIPFSKF